MCLFDRLTFAPLVGVLGLLIALPSILASSGFGIDLSSWHPARPRVSAIAVASRRIPISTIRRPFVERAPSRRRGPAFLADL